MLTTAVVVGGCDDDDNHDYHDDGSDADGGSIPHSGTTPLEVAVLEGHAAIADLLREHDAV